MPNIRSDQPKLVTISVVDYTKIPWGVNLEDSESTTFVADPKPLRFMPYANNYQASVTYEIWDSQKYYKRVDYGVLDWLSDVGGLYNSLALLVVLAHGWMVEGSSDLFVASELVASRHSKRVTKDKNE